MSECERLECVLCRVRLLQHPLDQRLFIKEYIIREELSMCILRNLLHQVCCLAFFHTHRCKINDSVPQMFQDFRRDLIIDEVSSNLAFIT